MLSSDHSLYMLLPHLEQIFVASRGRRRVGDITREVDTLNSTHTKVWEALGDPTVASIMSQGLDLQFQTPRPISFHAPACTMCRKAQVPFLRAFLPKLLARKIVRKVPTQDSRPFHFSLFLFSKKERTFCPVLELSRLNNYLVVPHFKIESIQSIALGIVEPSWQCCQCQDDPPKMSQEFWEDIWQDLGGHIRFALMA